MAEIYFMRTYKNVSRKLQECGIEIVDDRRRFGIAK